MKNLIVIDVVIVVVVFCAFIILGIMFFSGFNAEHRHPCPNDGSTKRFYDSRCNKVSPSSTPFLKHIILFAGDMSK